jgi:excinuclease ABC subunit A
LDSLFIEKSDRIRIVGAKTHNLKNIDLTIPRDQLVVFTGPSGSGKSSLAIDTLAAEGQRQYFQSLSLHSRQFFKQLAAANVDFIEGLPPTIFIDQATGYRNRRSTVGTLTEVQDYLRVLLARCGQFRCYRCHQPIVQHTLQQIERWVLNLPEKTKIMVLAPLSDSSTGDHSAIIDSIRRERLVRVRIDGTIFDIDRVPHLDADMPHSIAAVTDRLIVRPDIAPRLGEAVSLAVRVSGGDVVISYLPSPGSSEKDGSAEEWFSQSFNTRNACGRCGLEFEELQPSHFSFNTPHGACPTCQGLGELEYHSTDKDEDSTEGMETQSRKSRKYNSRHSAKSKNASSIKFEEANKEYAPPSSMGPAQVCPDCQGCRLSLMARSVFLGERNVSELLNLPISLSLVFFQTLTIPPTLGPVALPLISEILARLTFMQEVGLGYLSLARSVASLSGGEHQRVRLATSIGSGLANIAYILDEPSCGLHACDIGHLIASIRKLRSVGNTVFLVEHDESIILDADYLIDMGPGAGEYGGQIMAAGTPEQILDDPISLTGQYLSGRKSVSLSTVRRSADPGKQIELRGAQGRNLKAVDLDVPLGLFVVVSGISGSGKSTLINHTLVPAILNQLRSRNPLLARNPLPGLPFASINGIEHLHSLSVVDQRQIGRSTRGCPATVLGVFDAIRKVFAATKKAKQLGFGAARFSFNSKTGWCPDCRGLGAKRVDMNYLPDFFVVCSSCQGRRFNLQTLQVRFNEKTIDDVLKMSVDEARAFFEGFEEVALPLHVLSEVGMGYVNLGQPTTTLSGGESQRLKLAKELAMPSRGACLFVLDEPTTGLHFEDISKLLTTLNRIVDQGNSLIVVEHNLDVIRSADWVIDMGPAGGDGGGEIVAFGPPEILSASSISITARFLKS